MKRESAKILSDLLIRHGAEQHELLLQLEQTSSPDLAELRNIIAKTMGSIYLDALQPIFVEYPDLKPPGMP